MRLIRGVVSAVVLVAVFGLVVFVGNVSLTSAGRSAAAQAAIDSCGLTGEVAAYFSMEAKSSYRQYFPAMGKSPELDGVDDAFIVVYNGAVVHENRAPVPGLGKNNKLIDAVCVVLPSGDPIVYENVSRTGMALPSSAHIEVQPTE